VHILMTIALIAIMAAGAWYDVRWRRIPNDLTVPAIVLGLSLRGTGAVLAHDGWMLVDGLGGMAIAFAVTFPLFAVRGVGGGDVKLLMAAGVFLGMSRIGAALLLGAVVGGVMGLVQAWRRGVILPVLLGCRDLLVHCLTLGRAGARPEMSERSTLTIPYGVAIAVGSMAAWLM
jgi:prepilin peptidase CpaA